MASAPPLDYAAPLGAADHPDRFRGDPDFMLTLARGLQVIRAFGERRCPQTAAELSRRAGLPRAVTQRCLYTLSLLGFVSKHERRYVLTPLILSLGHAYFASTPFVSLAQPVLEELSATIKQTCALAIMESQEVMYLARSEVHRILATSLGLGSRLPAYCTTIGRVMLAQLSPAELQHYFDTVERPPYTEFTITAEHALREKIQQVQEQGYALADQEIELNVLAIGVPVRAASGKICSGLNVSIRSSQVPSKQLVSEYLAPMQAAAETIGKFLVF